MARTRLGAAGWATLIDQWHDSGLSLPDFCGRHGLNPGTMRGWVYKSAQRAAVARARREAHAGPDPDESPSPAFLPVRVAEPAPIAGAATGVEIVLGPDRRVAGAPGLDAPTPRRVVAALAGRPRGAPPPPPPPSLPPRPPPPARASTALRG